MDFYFCLPLYVQFPTKNWFVYVKLYYLQLFTIIAYLLNAHILLFRYVIINYIWHMGSQNYEQMILNNNLKSVYFCDL